MILFLWADGLAAEAARGGPYTKDFDADVWRASGERSRPRPRSVKNATPTSPPPAPDGLAAPPSCLGQLGRRGERRASRSADPRPRPSAASAAPPRARSRRSTAGASPASQARRKPSAAARTSASCGPVVRPGSRRGQASTARTWSTVALGTPVENTTSSTARAARSARDRRRRALAPGVRRCAAVDRGRHVGARAAPALGGAVRAVGEREDLDARVCSMSRPAARTSAPTRDRGGGGAGAQAQLPAGGRQRAGVDLGGAVGAAVPPSPPDRRAPRSPPRRPAASRAPRRGRNARSRAVDRGDDGGAARRAPRIRRSGTSSRAR